MEFKKFGEMSKEKIKWLEQKYRVTFPNDYKQFLLGNNGGFFNIENMNKVPVDELNDNIYIWKCYMDVIHLMMLRTSNIGWMNTNRN